MFIYLSFWQILRSRESKAPSLFIHALWLRSPQLCWHEICLAGNKTDPGEIAEEVQTGTDRENGGNLVSFVYGKKSGKEWAASSPSLKKKKRIISTCVCWNLFSSNAWTFWDKIEDMTDACGLYQRGKLLLDVANLSFFLQGLICSCTSSPLSFSLL